MTNQFGFINLGLIQGDSMRESIIVLGLPLSRTSVIAESISALGAFSGSKRMSPLLPSSSGAKSHAYYEYNEISQLNNQILIENCSSWDDVNFSLEDISSRKIKHYVNLAKEILREDYKYINKIVINDPKICLLFPVWERALNELGIKIKVLLVNSNPLEIAYLLKEQDKQSLEKGLILWSDYFFRSESYSRNYERIFANFPNDLGNFKAYMEQLAAFSGSELTDSILEIANQSYLLQLRNPHISLKNISLDFPPYLNKLISLLADCDFSNTSQFDHLYQEFSSLKKFFLAKNVEEAKCLEPLTEFKREDTRIAFDEGYYLDEYDDVRAARIDPFKHYQEYGWKEGRDPCSGFSTSFYLKSNPDVKQAGINPWQHYVTSGQYENRAPTQRFMRTIPVSSHSPSLLFVGHSALKGRTQLALLDTVKWYAENTTYQITILLLNPGILSAEFMRYGDVLTLNEPLQLTSDKTRNFLAHYYDLIYLNTPASGLFADIYKRDYVSLEIPVILHLHGLENDIEKYGSYYARIVNNVDLYIATSNDIADALINKYKINPDNISSYAASGGEIQNIFNHIRERYQFPASLSVIVPNYNHAVFLKERIDSVLKQSFYDMDVLLLDDASNDNSLAVIDSYRYDPRVKVLINKTCSGSPFAQWNKGIKSSASEYVWIAESDDACSTNLVKELLGAFNDPQVVLSYCKSEIIDENGQHIPGSLTQYMERGHLSKFNAPYVLDGHKEVEENFAVACTIVNSSSVVFKKAVIVDALDQAMQFSMCGDWYLYLRALCHGKIAYTTNAINYFRRHQGSTVHKVVGTDVYFKERYAIATEIVKTFNVSKPVLKKMLDEVDSEWRRHKHIPKKQPYETLFGKSNIIHAYESHVIPPMKIGFYVHGFLFSKGGIERLASDLANYLSNRGHKIVIFCRQHKGRPVYRINKDVSVVSVFDENAKHTISDLRDSLNGKNLDIFVPMLSEWIFEPVIEAAEGLGFPIIASEHNCPEIIETKWWNHEQRIKTFKKVDIVHLLRENYKESLPSFLLDKIRVINNGSYLGKWSEVNNNKKYFKRIISVGRLASQKRFDRLIQAFSILTESIDANWKLDIYGEGPEQEKLQALITHNNLDHRIKLRGNKNNLEREYLSSDFFVLPSEFEGDPVVLVEAKMFGLPCVAYKDCPGANEAIYHNVDGLLAEPDDNGVELAKQLVKLVQDRTLLNQFSKAAKENSKLLDMRLIAEQWEKMIHEAVFLVKNLNQ